MTPPPKFRSEAAYSEPKSPEQSGLFGWYYGDLSNVKNLSPISWRFLTLPANQMEPIGPLYPPIISSAVTRSTPSAMAAVFRAGVKPDFENRA
jgi:hypothetical protein